MMHASKPNDRILIVLCLCLIMAALNFLALTPFYPEVSSDLDVSISLLGQAVTFMILLSALLGLAIGPIIDRCGYRRPLTIGVCCVAINVIGAGLAPSFSWLLGISLLGGLADALAFGVPFAIVGVLFEPEQRKHAISWLIGSMSFGVIVGIPLLTVAGSATTWRLAMIALGGVAASVAVLTSFLIPDVGTDNEATWSLKLFRAAYAPVLQHAPTVRLLIATAIRSICWGGFLTYLGAFLSTEHHLSTTGIGVVYTFAAMGYAAGSLIAGRVIGSVGIRSLIGVMCGVSALATMTAELAASLWIAVGAIVVMSVASAVIAIGVTLLLSIESHGEQGTTMLLNSSLVNFGTAIGAAIGGGLIVIGGYPALGIGLSCFALMGAVVLMWGHLHLIGPHTSPLTGRILEPTVVSTPEPETGESI